MRVSLHFPPGAFDDARAAYLCDWQHGGSADTLARWVAAAITTHAARTTAERAAAALPVENRAGRGQTRSFDLPAEVVAMMHDAITTDQEANRWPSDSRWAVEAVAAAVDAGRTRAGGDLPAPPARLPNRLKRR